MSADSTSAPPLAQSRSLDLIGLALHGVVAVGLLVVALSGASIVLPVSLGLPTGGPGVFAGVDFAAAAAVVLFVTVVAHAAAVLLGRRVAGEPDALGRRRRAVRYLELSQVAGITMFLVAQLNGIAEAGTLILCYAVAAASYGVLWVQGRGPIEHRGAAWPYSLGAGIAVVPWGIVALYQVVAIAVETPPSPIVRVLTVVVLVLAAATWLIERRWQIGTLSDKRAGALHSAATLANGLALLVLAVGLARPSALF